MNNPVTYKDVDGNLALFAILGIIGAVVGAVAGGIVAAKNGDNVWKGALVGAVVGGVAGATLGAVSGAALAGSFTATAAQVATGAKAVATVVTSIGGTAGLTAGGKMILDNVSQAVNHAPQVFWSGGSKIEKEAQNLAKSIGGKTLEMTRLGQQLATTKAPASTWVAASTNFANTARGAAYVLQNSAGIRIASTWARVEYPILMSSKTNIIYRSAYYILSK